MTSRPVARVGSVFAMVAFGATIAGCSSSATQPYAPTQVNPLSGDIQLAVGTANIFGDVDGGANIGLNVVETFRQTKSGQHPGDTDALVTTPNLSGPFKNPAAAGTADANGATIETGPGPSDKGLGVMTGTAQPNPGDQTIAPSTFGVSTNASGFGLEPFNYTSVNGNNAGSPLSYVPYIQPLFDTVATDPNGFTPWGGPPAYDPDGTGLGTRDGNPVPTGVEGVSLGLDVFQGVTPAVGTYTLAVKVPTGVTTSGTATATATLSSAAILPAIAPATVVLDTNGDGGASVTATLPAGVTEALVQIVDIGPDDTATSMATANCNGALPTPVYYTLEFTASGTQKLPAAIGPGTGAGKGTPSICSAAANTAANTKANGGSGNASDGDAFIVQTIGYDYPAFEISYPNSSGNPAPTLLSGPQADITISSASTCAQTPTLTCAGAAAASSALRSRLLRIRNAQRAASRFHVIR